MLKTLPRANVNSNLSIFKTRKAVLGTVFPKQHEQRRKHNRAADLEKGRTARGLVGSPCPRGCGDAYAGAAGRRGSGGPVPAPLPVPAPPWPSPLAATEKRQSLLRPEVA